MGNQTWAKIKLKKWQQLYGSEISGANIVTYHRWWNDMSTQMLDVYDDYFYISESVTIDVIKYVTEDEAFGIPEAIEFEYRPDRNEWIDITDSVAFEYQRPVADSVGVTEDTTVQRYLQRFGDETVGVTEDLTWDVSWHFDESFPVAEAVAFEVSWDRGDNVGITEDVIVRLELRELHDDLIGITDEAELLVWDTSESGGMSLVDDVRTAVQTTLSLTDAQVAVLSINDLLHAYWSGSFPLGHTYDGSESTFSPVESYSTMDHHSSVEANEATDLNWIRSVTAT